jgi:methylase of polypeptide subunit release factors
MTRYILAPYVATPDDVVDRMLRLGKVTSKDVVYDLGCGDGRIVIAAAQQFGASWPESTSW